MSRFRVISNYVCVSMMLISATFLGYITFIRMDEPAPPIAPYVFLGWALSLILAVVSYRISQADRKQYPDLSRFSVFAQYWFWSIIAAVAAGGVMTVVVSSFGIPIPI